MSNTKETTDQLSSNYVMELIKACIVKPKVLEICRDHLRFEYLSTDMQKKVVKYIFDTAAVTGIAPTIGMIGQQFNGNKDAMSFLAKIKAIDVMGKEDMIVGSFEQFIKDVRFQRLYDNLATLYNEGKQEQAFKLLHTESEAINNFTIKAKRYVEVFSQFEERMKHREKKVLYDEGSVLRDRCTWGVHEMDLRTGGGPQKGRSFLGMAVSGGSKSLYLKWHALANARIGRRVVFFQGEDTEQNALTGLDAAWTGITSDNLEHANIPDDKLDAIMKTRKLIQQAGGKIYVVAEEEFDKLSIEDSKEIIRDIIKKDGQIDEVLYDYLEIMTTKGQWSKGESGERRRREDIANQITSVATAFNVVTGSMTQAADLKPMDQNNPDFVMTRHHASEFKGVVKPFSYFFTFNQTSDEYEKEELRIYFDKIRGHKAKGKPIRIIQARSHGRFYNAGRTLREITND